jgi:hypothetical protein
MQKASRGFQCGCFHNGRTHGLLKKFITQWPECGDFHKAWAFEKVLIDQQNVRVPDSLKTAYGGLWFLHNQRYI